MRINRIRDIAKVFGLELYEKFYLKLNGNSDLLPNIFQFQEYDLCMKESNEIMNWQNADYVLHEMINGTFEVVKINVNKNIYPTKAQMNYIRNIEDCLEVEFTGTTKQDATKFLNKYVPIYKHRLEVDIAEQKAMMETANIENSQPFQL